MYTSWLKRNMYRLYKHSHNLTKLHAYKHIHSRTSVHKWTHTHTHSKCSKRNTFMFIHYKEYLRLIDTTLFTPRRLNRFWTQFGNHKVFGIQVIIVFWFIFLNKQNAASTNCYSQKLKQNNNGFDTTICSGSKFSKKNWWPD